ncbi:MULTISPECIES: sporulation integral membrane protein YtvI [Paenibacillus]|uniref:Sporulation integral membrane protein YtvI n=1 Tax=Paenibacillus campinasensis TaxID=66347 RepID=A0A268F5B9_9BACL|nr:MULTISPECIES: sporulation integral membrane protein YtvI [Paenibacillus]MUG64443.1 sporulation integral membrane protein YtvI [Paenibacillus campinasensis]PAD80567.1 sporulation integral membrane protein YtvI [Paenibacillus campinasensis]PAK55165.1 sporulation integral membrane protein YtvI [Paenibacillus sp. 7541]
MLPLYKKYWRTAFDIALVVLTVYLIMFIFSKLYQIAAPVFLSFLVFLIIEPLAKFLHRRGLPKPIAAAISVLLFLMIIAGLLLGAGALIISQITHLNDNLPAYTRTLQTHFQEWLLVLQSRLDALPPDLTDRLNSFFQNITNFGANVAKSFFLFMVGFMGSFSSFIANFGIAMILAFFLSIEITSWRKIATDKTPKTIKIAFQFLKDHVFKAIGAYLKAQLKLVSITFVIVYVGLLILGTSNALSVALFSAVFDILPLLGVPVIFIPWIIYLFIVGNSGLAIGLIVLLAVVMVSRQLLEPKIAGNSIGISSAFLMLSFMIISLSIFGVAGLILAPILLILLKELLQQGYLQKWIHLPSEEFDVSPFDMTQRADPEPETEKSGEANKSIT